jgi:hypothetical protein
VKNRCSFVNSLMHSEAFIEHLLVAKTMVGLRNSKM